MRLAVYSDYAYARDGDRLYAERSFALFVAALRPHLDRLVLIGRLDPDGSRARRHLLPPGTELVALPHYPTLARPATAMGAFARSAGRLWHGLDGVDAVWVIGPHPLGPALAAMAALRGRRVALGVRQDLRAYVRHRHAGRPALRVAAAALELCWRLLARRVPVIVVGPDLARRYDGARRLLATSVSLVSEREVAPARRESRNGSLQLLTVTRLEPEKNPLLLADVLAGLRALDPRWRLVICGEGPMAAALEDRLRALDVARHAELRGYVPVEDGLRDIYRASDAFLHVSWTEGVPQVLYEAFGAGLPVVASAVGGVPAAVNGAALLVPPGDAQAAASALARVATDEALRRRLVEGGLAQALDHSIERESLRVARFLGAGGATGRGG